jgi:DNA-binding transcriptional LysR family regulator
MLVYMPNQEPRIWDLRIFVTTVRLGSQAKAADELAILANNVCKAVERVDEHFGGDLFAKRGNRRAEATPKGIAIAARVGEVLAQLDSCKVAVPYAGPIRVGCTPTMLKPLSEALQVSYPFSVRVREATGPVFRRLLAHGELDLAIGYNTSHDRDANDDYVQRQLFAEPLRLVLPRTRIDRRASPHSTLLAGLRRCYISPRLIRQYNDEIHAWLLKHGFDTSDDESGECQTVGEMMVSISTGNWYGFLPALCTVGTINDRVFTLPVKDLEHYEVALLGFYWPEVGDTVAPLLEELTRVCKVLAAQCP